MKKTTLRFAAREHRVFFSALFFLSLACNSILQTPTPAPAQGNTGGPAVLETPEAAGGFVDRGSEYGGLGEYDLAIADFKKAVELDHAAEWQEKAQEELKKLGVQ